MLRDKDLLSIQQARELVERAHQAEQQFKTFDQERVDVIVAAMAAAAEKNARRLAEMAVEETGRGKVEDKVIKNLFAAVDVHEYLKGLKTCDVIAENKEKKVVEIAVPFGVIAVIVPTTNPTSTTIFKILSALKGRNAVVVAPHPQAVRCTLETARVMDEAARQAGAPDGCVNCMDTVTLQGTNELMHHKRTALILATGGAAMVRAAYSSGKPAYGVGPGNVPSFIERTADVPKAVRDVLAGKTFDHGLLCSSEQCIVCDRPVEKQVVEELVKNRAYLCNDQEQALLEKLVRTPAGRLNADIAGKSPQVIAQMAGFSVPAEIVCLVGRPKGVGRDHPLSMEKLSPILGLYVVDGWEEGCRRCIEVLSYGGLGHTMSIHSQDRDVILEFGLKKPAYRICVNTPSTHGSVGLTTGVPPSMTLGCGSPGGNITSDNITALHLINVRRLAFETRPTDAIPFGKSQPAGGGIASPAPGNLRDVVRSVVEDYVRQKKTPPRVEAAPPRPNPPPPAPTPAAAPVKEPPREPAVDFVCEDDVRRALAAKTKITVHAKTIFTPAARDAASGKDVFVWQ